MATNVLEQHTGPSFTSILRMEAEGFSETFGNDLTDYTISYKDPHSQENLNLSKMTNSPTI
jgi:Golgi nucleoside diphosphatase